MTENMFSLLGCEVSNMLPATRTVKTTSKVALKEMHESGEIQAISEKIIVALRQLPGNRGIKSAIAKKARLKEEQVHKRLSELKSKGVIIESGKSYKSKITDKLQTEWQLIQH